MFKPVIVAIAVASAAPALAQDKPQSFNGPFIGIQGGWQQDRLSVDVGNASTSVNSSGFSFGAHAGYDLRVSPNVVLGGEVSLTGRTGSTEIGGDELGIGRTFNASARLGYVIGDNSLVYLRGGYSNARFTADDGVDSDADNRSGYLVGAGFEKLVSTRVSARIEYNYHGLGSNDLGDVFGANSSVNLNRHAVTAGLNFRF